DGPSCCQSGIDFTVLRPANAAAFPCSSANPGGQDVSGRVNVGMIRMSAVDTPELGLRSA
ncbi:MAG: hypothetical protein OXD42_06385, partial [Rhodospirillaceae bacterium]|nr:hypothetical protein [Rhodospirillaceae bacterium]